MALPCPICIHDSRLAIEQAILNGRPKAEIARNFGFTYQSGKTGRDLGDHKVIARHLPHMKGAYEAAQQDREVRSGLALANRLERLEKDVDRVLEAAWKGDPVVVGDTALLNDDGTVMMRFDLRLVLAAVAQARRNVALLAELQGAIPDGKDEEMAALRARLDTAEGRRLLAALDALDAQQDAGVARAD
jgi:hypothetical protein